jgi:hypothetical protein
LDFSEAYDASGGRGYNNNRTPKALKVTERKKVHSLGAFYERMGIGNKHPCKSVKKITGESKNE